MMQDCDGVVTEEDRDDTMPLLQRSMTKIVMVFCRRLYTNGNLLDKNNDVDCDDISLPTTATTMIR